MAKKKKKKVLDPQKRYNKYLLKHSIPIDLYQPGNSLCSTNTISAFNFRKLPALWEKNQTIFVSKLS